jgi:hypothetical protein
MQSLITGCENKIKVQQFFAEESKEEIYDIYTQCLEIDKDAHLGPARVVSGKILDI